MTPASKHTRNRISWISPLLTAVGLLLGSFLAAFLTTAGRPLAAQTAALRSFRIRETIGIRRTEYPVNARISFAKAVLKDAAQTRLVTNGAEVAAQMSASSSWDDGSVQALEVDFNASLDPGRRAALRAAVRRWRHGNGQTGAWPRGRGEWRRHPGRQPAVLEERLTAHRIRCVPRRRHRSRHERDRRHRCRWTAARPRRPRRNRR